MMRAAITVSLVPEARGGPFVFWDDLEHACARAAALGFHGIEIFAPAAEALRAESVRASIERHRLPIAAIGTGAGWVKHRLHLTHPDAATRAAAEEFILGMIDAAGALRAPAIIGSMQGRVEAGVEREQALDWLGDALGRLSKRAVEFAMPIHFEPLNRYETNLFNRVEDVAAFLRQRQLPNVRVLADLFHMNVEERSVPDALRALGDQLGHVHFVDSNRHAAGLGHLDFPPIIAALREIGYAGWLSAEALPLPASEAAAQQTIRAFHALLGEP